MSRFSILAVAGLFLCGVSFGADEPGPNYEHLKPMERLIGTWVLDLEAPEDAPPDSPIDIQKGDPIKLVLKCVWGLKKNVMRTQMTISVNGILWSTSEGTTGWAVDKEQIIASSFDTLGGRGESVNTVDGNTLTIKETRVSPDGVITKVTIIVTFVDKDTITSKRTGITVGDVEQPDEEPATWKRKT